jgi:hypothetical protein
MWCIVCDLENLKTKEAMASVGPQCHGVGVGVRKEEKKKKTHKAERS